MNLILIVTMVSKYVSELCHIFNGSTATILSWFCLYSGDETVAYHYSVALVCKQTIPTERPLLVGEVSANFSG
jgi:hypothetical protein